MADCLELSVTKHSLSEDCCGDRTILRISTSFYFFHLMFLYICWHLYQVKSGISMPLTEKACSNYFLHLQLQFSFNRRKCDACCLQMTVHCFICWCLLPVLRTALTVAPASGRHSLHQSRLPLLCGCWRPPTPPVDVSCSIQKFISFMIYTDVYKVYVFYRSL